jgi:GTP cyclohydrolase I
MDKPRIENAVRDILEAVGEDPTREGLSNTPARVARMYEEVLCGAQEDPRRVLDVVFTGEEYDEIIAASDIPFYSICEHHLAPFHGKVHLAYLPSEDGRITGLSKLLRVVEILSRRLQIQERLTKQIANTINEALNPRGVMVIVEAEHLCMSMRGIKKPNARITTSSVLGLFRSNEASRLETLRLLKG